MSEDLLLETTPAPGVAKLTLNRPERRNALDDALIDALRAAIARHAEAAATRVVMIAATGTAFCAGADLRGMIERGRSDLERNVHDAEQLAALLLAVHDCPKPVVALVQGPAFGGGVGLAAACDVTVAGTDARFRLPEVQLGIVPAVISPYVIAAIGARHARRLFLTGETIDAAWARELGLVHEVVATSSLEARGLELATAITQGGPQALAACKRLIATVAGVRPDAELAGRTARLLADLRAGPEAQEGLAAALEKRGPAWRQ
jgi:methylglutaconyl-CoA hydratase